MPLPRCIRLTGPLPFRSRFCAPWAVRRNRPGPWTTLFVLALPAAAAAQAPGYRGPDARQLRAEYRAEVIGRVNAVLREWGSAWARDDVVALTGMYVEDGAVVFPPAGPPLHGREAIRGWLANVLPEYAAADAFLQDLEASGGLAAVQTNYRIDLADGSGGQLTGTLFTVLLEQGRSWRIRSQVFRPTPEAVGGG